MKRIARQCKFPKFKFSILRPHQVIKMGDRFNFSCKKGTADSWMACSSSIGDKVKNFDTTRPAHTWTVIRPL